MNSLAERPRGNSEVGELTTASERETLKRAMLHWLDRYLEYAPRSQIRDIAKVLNHWEPMK